MSFSRHSLPTSVVAGFYGIGKRTLALKAPTYVRYITIKDYAASSDSTQECLKKLARDVHALEHSSMYRSIIVDAQAMVLDTLEENNIPYSLIYPENSEAMKKIIIERITKGGRLSKDEIEFIDSNYSHIIEGLKNREKPTKIELTPAMINSWDSWCLYF